jgi:hypothetical protein
MVDYLLILYQAMKYHQVLLPEEVRDDIKVGVSEGEYIVPADVLRYYGMKFFEDLRAEAKVALGGMEQDGRTYGW